MANKEHAVADANRDYFLALAGTRASLNRFPSLAGPIIFLLVVSSVGPLNASHFRGYEIYSYVSDANVVLIYASSITLFFSFFRRLIYRFQVFFSFVMASMAAVLVYSVCLLSLPIVAYVPTRDKELFTTLFCISGLSGALLVAGATAAHVLLLRRRLRVGHSEKRTLGNYIAVSGSNRSKMFWITFGVVAFVPNVLTRGEYLLNVMGGISLIVLALFTTSLPVEFTYLAYLKSKDRGYWEELPRLTAQGRQRLKEKRLRLAKKAVMWVVIAIASIGVVWLLGLVLPIWFG